MRSRYYYLIALASLVLIILWLHIALLLPPHNLGGIGAIFVTLTSANLFWLLPAFGLFAIAYILRAVRWWVLLRPFNTKGTAINLFPVLVGGIFLTYVVPLRAGDIATPYWLREKTGTRFTAGLSSILLARFLDFASLALIIVISAFLLFGALTGQALWFLSIGIVLGVVFIAFFILIRNEKFVTWLSGMLGRLFKPSNTLKEEVPAFVENFAVDMRKDIGSWNSGLALLLSVPLWVIETFKLTFLALAFGQTISLLDSVFISALSYTGGHLLGFLLPAGIGIFVLQIVGITTFLETIPGITHTVGIALLDGLIYIIGLSILGVPSLATMGREYRRFQEPEEPTTLEENPSPREAG
ncbi:MAG: lysylphosphatidylglycerol synthase transmembrane domain-containing protein [Candidatus Hodarchaeota archaeon]